MLSGWAELRSLSLGVVIVIGLVGRSWGREKVEKVKDKIMKDE